ncbi:MAG: hypothetical protein ACOC7O_02725, partial [Thermoplasmatota archaeon]
PPLPEIYKENEFNIKYHVLSLKNKSTITDKNGEIIGFSKSKMFKFKDDIRIYKTEEMREEVFRIKQRNIMDFNANFEIIDSLYDSPIGYLKKKPLESFSKNKYVFLGPAGGKIGEIKISGSLGDAVSQSFKAKWSYEILYDNYIIGSLKEKMTLTKYDFKINIFSDQDFNLDRRFPLAAAMCIAAGKGNI